MAKKRGKGKGQKPTLPDNPMGPRPLSKAQMKRAAEKQQAEVLEEFEKRKRAQIAKAALELDTVDAHILTLHLQHPAITQEAIGDAIGMTRQTVNERMNAPKFKRAIEIATRSALEIFEGNKAAAARKLGELIQSPDHHVAIRASIAHMWPHIHADTKGDTGADFVAFIQEAFERASAGKDGETSNVVPSFPVHKESQGS